MKSNIRIFRKIFRYRISASILISFLILLISEEGGSFGMGGG